MLQIHFVLTYYTGTTLLNIQNSSLTLLTLVQMLFEFQTVSRIKEIKKKNNEWPRSYFNPKIKNSSLNFA